MSEIDAAGGYRRRWIRRMLIDGFLERPEGLRQGIYGAEVCQICGRVGRFFGWAAAMGLHFPWGGTEFVCADCCRDLIPAEVHDISERVRYVKPALAERAHRYCQLCLAAALKESRIRVGRHWLCGTCRDEIVEHGGDPELFADELVRRRYEKRDLEAEARLRRILDSVVR